MVEDKRKPRRTKWPDRMQVGATINTELWKKLKIQAITEDRTTAELLDECIKDYLKKSREK